MAQALPAGAGGTSGPAVRAGTVGDRGRRWGRAIAGNTPGRQGTAQRKRAPRSPPPAPGSVFPYGEAGTDTRGGPTRGSAQGVVIAAHRRCEHRGGGGSGPRPEQESSLAARRHFRQLHSPALLTVFCAVSQKRPAAARAGPGKPSPSADAGSESLQIGPGLGDPPPASARPPLATPPLLPFTLLPPPTGPHFAPRLRAAAAPWRSGLRGGRQPCPLLDPWLLVTHSDTLGSSTSQNILKLPMYLLSFSPPTP